MKNSSLFFWLILMMLISSCNKKTTPTDSPQIKNTGNFEIQFEKAARQDPMFLPINWKLARDMRKDFRSNAFLKLSGLGLIKDSVYVLSKDNWKSVYKLLKTNSEASKMRFYFVQYNKDKFKENHNYEALKDHDGQLYMVMGCFDGDRLIGNKYYAVFSVKKMVEIDPEDFKIMYDDFEKNIEPHLKSIAKNGSCTKYIKIPLVNYWFHSLGVNAYDIQSEKKIKQLQFKLAEVQDVSKYSKIKFFDYYLRKYKKNEGQLTFVTNTQDTNDNDVHALSNYDMNSLCPQTCP